MSFNNSRNKNNTGITIEDFIVQLSGCIEHLGLIIKNERLEEGICKGLGRDEGNGEVLQEFYVIDRYLT